MADPATQAQLDRMAALAVPARRAIYGFIAGQDGEVTRNEVAKAAGISRALAAFHLEKLVEAGLLEVSFRRVSGRSGPGAGRTSKLYRRATKTLELSLPGRRYELAASLLARAVQDAGTDAVVALDAAAVDAGRQLGEQAREHAGAGASDPELRHGLRDTLARSGFEPREDDAGRLVLGNCPFGSLASASPRLICGMNLALCRGMAEGLAAAGLHARLDPGPGRCCVVFEGR
jgi:predicted ArsR family transcriptional regulator